MSKQELIVDPSDPKNQKNALQMGRKDGSYAGQCAALSMMLKMDHGKARRFFTDLHDDLVPMWLQNEIMDVSDLVRLTTALYLNS